MTKRSLLPLALAILLPAGAQGAAPVWPSLAEQLKVDRVVPKSALEALIAAHQDFSLLRPEEARDKLPIPLWLRVLWRRAHPEDRYPANDPTGGYPFVLKEVAEWMRLHQDLRPGPPQRDTPPELDEDAITPKVIAVGTDRRISGPQASSRSESDIRVNYWNPLKIISAANNLSGDGQAQFYSTDGGVTWGQTTLPLNPGEIFHSDPAVDWTSDGTAWATTIGISFNGFTTLQMKAYKSTDNGATWTFDATFSGTQTKADKELMWVDHSATSPFKNNIYVIWHNGPPAYVNRRTGPGGSWQTPIQVSGPETMGTAIGSDIKTNANGDVFAFWPDTGMYHLFMAKSTNGGASFGTPVQIAPTSVGFDVGVPAMNRRRASIYVSGGAYRTASKNLVYASWTDLKGGTGCNGAAFEPGSDTSSPCKTRIWFARSTNGGATWSAPVMINNQASLNDQFHQWLVVDETSGALGIIYYDTVGDLRRKKVDVWYQSSHDDGVTWSPAVKVTSAQTDETTEQADPGNQFGDYNSLSGIAGQLFASWTDRRNNAREEIWSAKIGDVLCTPPGAPAIGTASGSGPNQVRITWANGSPAASIFNLSRAAGTCAAPGPFTRIASALAGSPFTDGTVSGGSTYTYRVTGTDASGVCESGPSSCVQATATGACLLPPSFAGLANVTNQAATVCGLALSWPAATPACAGPVTYNVYRSMDPGFTPSAANRIASQVTGTGYVDTLGSVADGTSFFYAVRAVDGSNGVEDGNSVKRGAAPTGPAVYLLNETFEGAGGFDNPGWTHSTFGGDTAYDWTWTTAQSQSATHSWLSPSAATFAQKALISPAFVPQMGSILSFWHTYSFDDGSGCYDGGLLWISTDGGSMWFQVPSAAFLTGGYNGTLASSNPMQTARAWCVGTLGPMTQVKVDLSAYAGMAVKVRWFESDDTAFKLVGWYVDDVSVGSAGVCKDNPIFSDSFESGTLPGVWSGTIP
jgi:hypothetical protein